jgi:acetaldehyde dehydrogenase/alcohol dehydrogenase
METSSVLTPKQTADLLVKQAREAAAIFTQYNQEQVDRIVEAAAKAGAAARIELARLACEETGMGLFEDKVIKNLFATEYIYNDIRNLKTVGLINESGSEGMLEYAEPLGIILAIIPVTNPTSTTMFKSLLCLKTRNSVIVCASRNARRCSVAAAKVVYEAAIAAGAPDYAIRWVEEPSRELTKELMSHSDLSLILATGGMSLVQAAYGSGTPAIGVGPGNVPVYVERSANIRLAVHDIILSKTFDHGMVCASEQAVVVDREIEGAVVAEFIKQGAYFLSEDEKRTVETVAIDSAKQSMSPQVVGQPPQRIAQLAGIRIPEQTRVLVARLGGVGAEYPLSREKLCPILGFYVVQSFEEGVNLCTDVTHFGGLGHTASLFSEDETAVRRFSETINAGRIIVNAPSTHGGIGDIYNRIRPSLTLGCGAGGKNITSDNVTVASLLNVKRTSRRMVNMKWFRVPGQIYFEPGCLDTFFTNEIKALHASRAVIVCSGSAIRQGAVVRIEEYLRRAGIASSVFSDISPDPTLETVEKGTAALRRFEPDLIIAIGGGSPLDAAKAMWLFYEDPSITFADLQLRFMDIRKRVVRFPKLGRKAVLIAIPTTSGTGSEVTAFTVITDSRTSTKYALADYAITPDIAIIDPNLTLTVPKEVTADTGLDVLAHAVESFVSVMASDYTDPLALQAIRLVFEYLPRACENGRDGVAREKMHNAATIAGMAFTNAFLGINHCLAHILGATFHIPHGRANALVMPAVIRYNGLRPGKYVAFPNCRYAQAAERYAEIARTLGLETGTPRDGVESLCAAVKDLIRRLNMPATVREAGISEIAFREKVRMMSETAFNDQCTGANPSYPLVEDLEKILWESFG